MSVVGDRRIVCAVGYQSAPVGLQLLRERSQYPRAPIVGRRERHSRLVSFSDDPPRDLTCFVLRRQRELIETRRRRAIVGKEVQGENRRPAVGIIRGGGDLRAGQRADDELGAVLDRPGNRFRDAGLAGVVDPDLWSLRDRSLIERR